ncbi:MAG: hypothetical protein JWR37_318 [Mycobacterium sp.]|jgi:hypothetical protein|nr:hypothetical protein [Mycobacterium sp.]
MMKYIGTNAFRPCRQSLGRWIGCDDHCRADGFRGARLPPRPTVQHRRLGYFTTHPQEYYDLRGILAPIGDAQRQRNVTLFSPDLASAYDEFMAG